MDVASSDIGRIDNRFNGGRTRAFLSVQRHKPPGTAIHAIGQSKVPVEGYTNGGGVCGFVEGTAGCIESSFVQISTRDARESAVCPLGMVEVRSHQRITSCRGEGERVME